VITNRAFSVSRFMVCAALCAQASGCGADDPAREPESGTDTSTATACNLVRAGGPWWNLTFTAQTRTFHADFDVTPSAANVDAVVGLSNGSAASFAKLAAVVRFNPAGQIDVRAGSEYRADAAYPYQANTAYHVHMDVNVAAHTYSVRVGPTSLAYSQPIATNYPFRTEQASVAQLSNVASKVDSATGSVQVCGFEVGPGNFTTDGCLQAAAGDGMLSMQMPDATVLDTVDFSATPSAQNVDAVIGFSAGNAAGFNDLATAVRFAPNGVIDARDGDTYRADYARNYGTTETSFRVVADVSSHTYSVLDNSYSELARQYHFRTSQQSIAHLDHLNVIVDGTAGSVKVCAHRRAPSTDIAYSREGTTAVAPLADDGAYLSDGSSVTHVDAAGRVLATNSSVGGKLVADANGNVLVVRLQTTALHVEKLGPDLRSVMTKDFVVPEYSYLSGMGAGNGHFGFALVYGDMVTVYGDTSNGGFDALFTAPGNAAGFAGDAPVVGFGDFSSNSVRITQLTRAGAVTWSRAFSGNAEITSIAVDPTGAVVFGGRLYGSIDFGGGPLYYSPYGPEGGSNAYVAKLSATGAYVFAVGTGDSHVKSVATNGSRIEATGDYETQFYYLRRHTFDANGNEIASVGVPGLAVANAEDWGFGDAVAMSPSGRVWWNLRMSWPTHFTTWPFMVVTSK
jgi:hypothetical protein